MGKIQHGHAKRGRKTRTYSIWSHMRRRCNDPRDAVYCYYGGRGITVCDRWASFENFLADMGECPPGLTIERIANDKGYAPGNCKWATYSEQVCNRRYLGRRLKPCCKWQHAYTPENTRWNRDGSRTCLTCKRISRQSSRKRPARQRQERPARPWIEVYTERILAAGRGGSTS